MSADEMTFAQSIERLEALNEIPLTQLARECVVATVDGIVKSGLLSRGVDRLVELEQINILREQVGLPRFEIDPIIPEGSEVLSFDFSDRTVTNSLGIVLRRFGSPVTTSRRSDQSSSRAIREVHAITRHISESPGWVQTTEMYELMDEDRGGDVAQHFNNQWRIAEMLLGGRIAIADKRPRKIMMIEPFEVRIVEPV